jgi:hypothetical protein
VATHKLQRNFNQAELDELRTLANQEKHAVIHPTHLLKKNNELMGYASITGIPLVHSYFSSRCDARDSVKFIDHAETHLRACGHNHYFIFCLDSSPFHPIMPKLGFKELFMATMFTKEL